MLSLAKMARDPALEVAGPGGEDCGVGRGQEVTDDPRKSRWAAPGPGVGSHPRKSPIPPLTTHPYSPGALMTPRSPPPGPPPLPLRGPEGSVCYLPGVGRV